MYCKFSASEIDMVVQLDVEISHEIKVKLIDVLVLVLL